MSLAKKMGDKHDAHIAEVYGLKPQDVVDAVLARHGFLH